MATVRDIQKSSNANVSINSLSVLANQTPPRPKVKWEEPKVLTTLYSWPTMEPMSFSEFEAKHLNVPLRRDILHRAVVYEGDKTRQGTASTKWRDEVSGSGRKILPQKGTGHARARDRMSPIRRGGGVAHGPHPRDFSTGLQRKVYDLAWRTALSYRYRKGELIVIGDAIGVPDEPAPTVLEGIFVGNSWGRGQGRSTLVTTLPEERLYSSMEEIGHHGLVKDILDIDVKDLLETGRIIIEKEALESLLLVHQSDVGPSVPRSVLENLVKLKLSERRKSERRRLREQLDTRAEGDGLSDAELAEEYMVMPQHL